MVLISQLYALSAWGHMVTASLNVQQNVCGTTISPSLQYVPTNPFFCVVLTNPSASIGNAQEVAPVVIMTNTTYVQDALPPLMVLKLLSSSDVIDQSHHISGIFRKNNYIVMTFLIDT
jgi:hypothetical protein